MLPLVLAHGAGSELHRATGVAVFFGMIGVTVFGQLLAPVFYVVLAASSPVLCIVRIWSNDMIRTLLSLGCVCLLAAAEPITPRAITLVETVPLSASVALVGMARIDVAIARAGLGAQRMALLPQVSATGGLTRLATGPAACGGPIHTSSVLATSGMRACAWDRRILDLDAWHRTSAADRRLAVAEVAAHARVNLARAVGVATGFR